jgi:aspartate-semialdehyde dehydrogenase
MERRQLPLNPIHVCEEEDRPQPRHDRNRMHGYGISVGRIRSCNVLDVKLVLVVHNTVLGGAGGTLLNAELAYTLGFLD